MRNKTITNDAGFHDPPDNLKVWNFFPKEQARNVFAQTLGKLVGVRYKLIAVQEQRKTDMLYRFLCSGQLVIPLQTTWIFLAEVEVTTDGAAAIRKIQQHETRATSMPKACGSWQHPGSEAAVAVLAKIQTDDSLTLYASTKQTAENGNLCMLCSQTAVPADEGAFAVLVFVGLADNGESFISEIQQIW